ncbi:hypothetical protein ACHABX_08585 [Nesterenkonia halotolerans]|uniref:hypothetical protein n=1 Tax=Nesterenkonia halotolerans TaxID=225325 RepID=UPI003EE72C47
MSATTNMAHPRPDADSSGSPATSSTASDDPPAVKTGAARNEEDSRRRTISIAAKVTPETKLKLDIVMAMLGSENTSRGIADIIEIVADAVDSADTAEAAQKALVRRLGKERSQLAEAVPAYDRQLLEELRDALHSIDASYREMTFEIQRVSFDWNQIARVANLIGRGSDDRIPATAIDAVRRRLDTIDKRLGVLSGRDTAIKTALSWLRK